MSCCDVLRWTHANVSSMKFKASSVVSNQCAETSLGFVEVEISFFSAAVKTIAHVVFITHKKRPNFIGVVSACVQ